MAYLAIRFQVQDFNAWEARFDRFAPERRAAGEVSYQIYHMDDDRNRIVMLQEWATVDAAKAMIASDALKNAMQEAGVTGEPIFFFLNAGDSGRPWA